MNHNTHSRSANNKLTLLLVWLLFTAPLSAYAAETSFSWLPNSEPTLSGYNIHYGQSPGEYTTVVDVGNPDLQDGELHATITGLADSTKYYAVATAYDENENESPFSPEISWTTPDAAGTNNAPNADNVSINTNQGTEITGQLHATDADGDPLSYSIASDPTKGSITVTSSGSFTYTPDANEKGTDHCSFIVNDGTEDSAPATITITIIDDNNNTPTLITTTFGQTPDADVPNAIKDTYTNVNATVYADAEILTTYSWSRPSPNKVSNTIILKVDLSALPDDAIIEEAKLALYQTKSDGEATYRNSIHKIIHKNPSIVTTSGMRCSASTSWTPAPGETFNEDTPLGLADIDTAEDELELDSQNGYREWTITNMVQSWVNTPDTNYGLLIKGEETGTSTGRNFASSDNPNSAIRPKILVKYRRGGTPPVPRIRSIRLITP